MNNYCGGPTWLQWVKQVLDKINEVVERINNLTADVKNVRQLPSGGSHGQVATPTEDGSGYEWVDQSGGGGTGDVTSKGDNTFTGKNTFTQPVTVGEGTSPNHAATVHQVTELGNEVNAIAGASVTKDNAQTITGVKTFAVSPKVPNPTDVGDATPKSYVDNEVDTASSETLNEAKTYADGLETKIKDAAVADIKAADNVFTGNNTFANPVSVGTPTADSEAATKKYVDDADNNINTNINQLTQNQTALQEEVQQIQNGALGRMNAATVADKDKVWTSTEANPSGEFVTPAGGGSNIPDAPRYPNRYLRTKDSKGTLEWGTIQVNQAYGTRDDFAYLYVKMTSRYGVDYNIHGKFDYRCYTHNFNNYTGFSSRTTLPTIYELDTTDGNYDNDVSTIEITPNEEATGIYIYPSGNDYYSDAVDLVTNKNWIISGRIHIKVMDGDITIFDGYATVAVKNRIQCYYAACSLEVNKTYSVSISSVENVCFICLEY